MIELIDTSLVSFYGEWVLVPNRFHGLTVSFPLLSFEFLSMNFQGHPFIWNEY